MVFCLSDNGWSLSQQVRAFIISNLINWGLGDLALTYMHKIIEVGIFFLHTVAPKINVTRKSLWSSNIAIEFMHPNSYPATGSRFHRELKYEIVSVIGELMQTCLSNTKRTEIEGGSKTPFRVKVSYGNGRFKDLGHIFSDKYKPSKSTMLAISSHCDYILSYCGNVPTECSAGIFSLVALLTIFLQIGCPFHA